MLNKRLHVLDCTHTVVLLFCSTVERLSPAHETMELPPKKEEKRVCFYDFVFTIKAGKCFKNPFVACFKLWHFVVGI